jgi:lipid A 3-O-deacylase
LELVVLLRKYVSLQWALLVVTSCLTLATSSASFAQTARCANGIGPFDVIKKYQGTYSVTLDNDLFSNRDQDYTSGFKAAWSSPNVRSFADDPCLPPWLEQAGKLFTQVYSPSVDQGNVTFTLGQAIYTPRDRAATALVATDRPYAGWSYLGFGYNTRSASRLDSYEVNLGVVGPWSRAKELQDVIHRARGFALFQGWKNQLGNEFGAQLVFERKYRTEFLQNPDSRDGFGFDVIPHFGFSLGNVATYANAGFELRAGWGLPDDYGTSPIRPAGDNSAPRARDGASQFTRQVGAHVFASVDGRGVVRNIFLDGNSIRDSHSVNKERWVADAAVGAAANFGVYKIAYVRVFRTREFLGQVTAPRYGSITISGPL